MFDIGWPELFVMGAVALVAVGPNDLPKVMHRLGRLAGRARAAMSDLGAMIEQVGVEAELAARAKDNRDHENEIEPAGSAATPPSLEGEDRGVKHDDVSKANKEF
jgi:sec-independent protein translocase protein TatB